VPAKPHDLDLQVIVETPAQGRRKEVGWEKTAKNLGFGGRLWRVVVNYGIPARSGDEVFTGNNPYAVFWIRHYGDDMPARLERWAIVGDSRQSRYGGSFRVPLATFERAAFEAVEHGTGTSRFQFRDGQLAETRKVSRRKPRPQPRLALKRTHEQQVERAALVYRAAVIDGNRAPTKAVAGALAVSRTQAGRLLTEARELRLLGPAIPRRAGWRTSERGKAV
jgi:hypothetical protein